MPSAGKIVGAAIAAMLGVTACSAGEEISPATLYRNSMLDPSMRIHFASFDAPDKGPFNIDNCEMVARALNANVDASSAKEGKPRNERLGFWCEVGGYREEGVVPMSFESEFPTDSKPYRQQ